MRARRDKPRRPLVTREEARAYLRHWEGAAERERDELRRITMDEKFRQLGELMLFARAIKPYPTIDPEELEVWQRWQKYRRYVQGD